MQDFTSVQLQSGFAELHSNYVAILKSNKFPNIDNFEIHLMIPEHSDGLRHFQQTPWPKNPVTKIQTVTGNFENFTTSKNFLSSQIVKTIPIFVEVPQWTLSKNFCWLLNHRMVGRQIVEIHLSRHYGGCKSLHCLNYVWPNNVQ